MPTTINGIGTHYYGKQDAASRPGACQQCGASGVLESYTTRLWFVVVFIPVIPLKRVRILDACPSCTRHWVADPEKYEQARQLAVSEALEKHRQHPTMESALETHAQCLVYHMHNEADLFREAAILQFPNNVELLAGLASHLDQTGRWDAATPLYEQLVDLKPESPEFRTGLAWRRTKEGRLDEAYELLDFLHEPGASKSYQLDLLQELAQSYQKCRDHEKTLELCEILLRENPAVEHQYVFRSLMSKSEKALGRESSQLKKREVSIRSLLDSKSGDHPPWMQKAILGALAVTLFISVMAGINEYHRRHRTLYVISEFVQPVEVSIDGAPAVLINRTKIPFTEGKHQISISGAVTKQMEADLRSPYFSRWLSSPIWVLNVENLSELYLSKMHYAVNPRPTKSNWLKEEINYIPHVDYPFENPPQSLKVEGANAVVTKIHVETNPVQPATIIISQMGKPNPSVAMAYAEGYLDRHPKDAMVLGLYASFEKGDDSGKRVADYLKSKLWSQPISVEWHRMYQSLKSVEPRHAELVLEYDTQLKKSPKDAALLYLRGRISPTREEQLKYFHQAYEQRDVQLGWPAAALAVDAANRGEWREAKEWCDQAIPYLGADPSFRTVWHAIQIANADTSELEAIYRKDLESQNAGEMISGVFYLTEVLAAQGKLEDARKEYLTWWNRVANGQTNAHGRTTYELMVDYVCGDTAAFLQKQSTLDPDELSSYQFHFLLATGQPDAAAKMPDLTDTWSLPLALSVSYAIQGNQTESDLWRAKAIEILRQGDADSIRAADSLEGSMGPTDAELDEIVLRLSETPLLLMALAQRFPDRSTELAQRAAKLNVGRLPPYLLVKQSIDANSSEPKR